MSTATNPLLVVEAQPVAPYQYGLASVAVPADQSDGHWQLGVQQQTLAAYVPGVVAGACGGPWNMGVLPSGQPVSKGLPFTVIAGVDCAAVGYTADYIQSRARAVLDLGWQYAAEQALWGATSLTSQSPQLNAAGVATSLGTGLSITAAISALEAYMASHYMGVATIHAPRAVAAYAAKQQQLRDRVGKLQTVLGTQLVFGGGYDGTGPSDAAPASNSLWLYATGVITVRRNTPVISGGLDAALNRSTNDAPLFAQQTVVLTLDGPVAAAEVDLTAA